MGYQTVFKRNESEYVEKRSRFIATLCHCETEEEANAFVKEMKSKYWDARHNCYAYSVEEGRACRFSDDGEPHGTAGKPMLDCIQGSGITNIAVVVTRYFGGILLGTGGLVRAYSKSTQDVLASAEIYIMLHGVLGEIVCEYSDLTLLQNLIAACDGEIRDTEYTDKITITLVLKDEFCSDFKDKLRETFCARLEMEEKEHILLPFLKK